MDLKAVDGRSPSVEVERSGLGQFVFNTVTDSWWWSDGMFRLYGYDPHSVSPTLERFLEHKDPADMARIDSVFDRCMTKGGPFSCYHHIVDANGKKKTVVVVGYGERDAEDARTIAMHGFMVDVTASNREDANAAVQAALETRAGIEQVKGALMLVHGVDADAAFDLLRSHSQVYNKKVAAIVADVLDAFRRRNGSGSVSAADIDQMLWQAANRSGQ